MEFIVAVNDDWAIGCSGRMLYHVPADLAFFKCTTDGHIVLMGRKTFESLPNGALPNRINVVLTNNRAFKAEGVHVIHTVDEMAPLVAEHNDKTVFVIGGGSLYHDLLDRCDAGYVTVIHAQADDVDTWFPKLDEKSEWRVEDVLEDGTDNGLSYTIKRYVRRDN